MLEKLSDKKLRFYSGAVTFLLQVVEELGELGGVTMRLLEPETTLTESPTRAATKTPPRWSSWLWKWLKVVCPREKKCQDCGFTCRLQIQMNRCCYAASMNMITVKLICHENPSRIQTIFKGTIFMQYLKAQYSCNIWRHKSLCHKSPNIWRHKNLCVKKESSSAKKGSPASKWKLKVIQHKTIFW